MKSGAFISLVANVYRVEEKTVFVVARALKEAGLLTSGARGVNAPHMLPLDAARMTIALLSTDSPARMVEAVRRYRAMKLRPDEVTGTLPDAIFHDDPTLEQVLVRLFAAEPHEGVFGSSPYIEIRENDKRATVELKDAVAIFRSIQRTDEQAAQDRREHGGIRRSRGVASIEMLVIATNMWADRFRGSDEQGNPLDLDHPWNRELRGADRARRFEEINAYIRKRDVDWMKGA